MPQVPSAAPPVTARGGKRPESKSTRTEAPPSHDGLDLTQRAKEFRILLAAVRSSDRAPAAGARAVQQVAARRIAEILIKTAETGGIGLVFEQLDQAGAAADGPRAEAGDRRVLQVMKDGIRLALLKEPDAPACATGGPAAAPARRYLFGRAVLGIRLDDLAQQCRRGDGLEPAVLASRLALLREVGLDCLEGAGMEVIKGCAPVTDLVMQFVLINSQLLHSPAAVTLGPELLLFGDKAYFSSVMRRSADPETTLATYLEFTYALKRLEPLVRGPVPQATGHGFSIQLQRVLRASALEHLQTQAREPAGRAAAVEVLQKALRIGQEVGDQDPIKSLIAGLPEELARAFSDKAKKAGD